MARRRRSAEDIARGLKQLTESSDENRDRLELLHDVQVYQEELTVQNAELTRTQAALEQARDLYVELYDFAPNGYLTLDRDGLILQLNLTASALLGKQRRGIEGLPFLGFVATEHRAGFLDFLRRCRRQPEGTSIQTELVVATPDGTRTVQLLCRARKGDVAGGREYLTTIIDVSDQKRLEAQRDDASRERAALAGRLIAVQDDERQRIARDLHDNAGQQMTALRLKLAALGTRAPATLSADIGDVQSRLDDLDRQLDFLAAELRPAVLDVGIVAALGDFVREWSVTHAIPAGFHTLRMDGERLPPDVETHVYRVAQEALHNVYKHSGAANVSVLLERRPADVVLVIEDDGKGFDAVRHKRGFGLIGMRERAAIVHGTLELESVLGRGTTVYLRIPMSEAPAPDPKVRARNRL